MNFVNQRQTIHINFYRHLLVHEEMKLRHLTKQFGLERTRPRHCHSSPHSSLNYRVQSPRPSTRTRTDDTGLRLGSVNEAKGGLEKESIRQWSSKDLLRNTLSQVPDSAKALSSEKVCCICLENKRVPIAFVSCGHSPVCKQCCSHIIDDDVNLITCPVCRSVSDEMLRLFDV
jgi:hypothetical protein